MSRLKSDYRVESVFESEMTIGADDGMGRVFNTALLDHMIKLSHEDADDIRADGGQPRRIRYRVRIEVADVEVLTQDDAGGEG